VFSSLRRLIPHRTSVSGAGQGAGDSLLDAFDGSTQRARVAIGTCVGLHRPESFLRRSIIGEGRYCCAGFKESGP